MIEPVDSSDVNGPPSIRLTVDVASDGGVVLLLLPASSVVSSSLRARTTSGSRCIGGRARTFCARVCSDIYDRVKTRSGIGG